MADYLATALVRVRPDTKNFTTELRADLKNRIKNIKLTVPVRADLKAFHQQINRELKAQPIKIPVVPDMTGFQAELRRRVESSARGVKAKIQVEAVGGVSGAALTQKIKAPPVAINPLGNINRAAVSADALGNVSTVKALTEATKAQAAATAQATQKTIEADRARRESIRSAKDQAKAERSSALAASRLVSATRNVAAATASATKEHVLITAIDREQAAAERSLTSATAAGSAAREKTARSILDNVAAQRALVRSTIESNVAQKQAIASDVARAASQKQLVRGGVATALSQLGARGATLAAGSQFLIGAAAITTLSKAVTLAADLQQNLNVFNETAHATADEMDRVAASARQLGADVTLPSVSAGDAAEAMTGLAKAGLSVQESINGARGVLQLATAAQISNADATELAASALNSFGLSGGQAVHVADLLTGSANATQGSITDIGIALQQSSAVARQANLSLEDTVALLSLLAKNGIRGSDAGTSLRTAILRLIAPTKQAQKILDQLGVSAQDATGAFQPEVFSEFAKANERFSARQAATNARIVFGQDAIRAFSIAAREGSAGLDDMRARTNDFGAAQRLAEARTKGLSGAVNGLVSNLETLGTNLGTFTLGPLTQLARGFTEATGDINLMIEQVLRLEGLVGKIKIPDISLDVGPLHVDSQSGALGDKAGHAFGVAFGNAARVGVLSRVVPLPVAIGVIAARKFLSDTESIRANAEKTRAQVRELFATFEEAPGPSSLGDLVVGLKALSSELASGDQTSQKFARSIDDAIRKIQDTGRIPPPDFSRVFGPAGEKAGASFLDGLLTALDDPAKISSGADIIVDSLRSTLDPKLAHALGFDFMQSVGQGLNDGVESVLKSFPQSAARIATKFEEQILNAQISGNRGQELSLLRRQESDIQAQLDRGVEDRAKRIKLKEALKEVQNDIESIQNGIASDAQAAATKINDAQQKADQAIINAIALEEHRRQNAIARAALTPRLADDIATNKALRKFYIRSLAEVRSTVRDAAERANQIAALTGQLIAAEDAIARAQAEQREARKKHRQEARDRANESLELDVQIAEATGNKNKEERARKAVIASLERQIRNTRAGSLQRKRLILALRQEQKELRDLQKERAKAGDEFKKLAFQFLTTQQGFAANLFGNLLGPTAIGKVARPSTSPATPAGGGRGGAGGGPQKVLDRSAGGGAPSSTGGSGGITIDSALSKQGALSETQGKGPTKAQATVELDLLRQILRVLRGIQSGHGHQDAKTHRNSKGGGVDVL